MKIDWRIVGPRNGRDNRVTKIQMSQAAMNKAIVSMMLGMGSSCRRRLIMLALSCTILLNLNSTSWAQRPAPEGDRPRPASGEQKPAEAASPKTDEKAAPSKTSKKVLAVVGGDIITVTRERIRKGTILVEDGKIVQIGQNLEIPEGAVKIDATGKTVTPGFVAVSMSGVGVSFDSQNSSLADSLNPYDRNIQLSLGVGITSGVIQRARGAGSTRRRRAPEEDFPEISRFPGFDPDEFEGRDFLSPEIVMFGEARPLCPCCNLPVLPTEPITPVPPSPIVPVLSSVIKMSYQSLDGMVLQEQAFVELTPGALSGPVNQAAWRTQLTRGREYLKEQAAHEQAIREGKKVNPPRRPVSDEILALIKREVALRISGSRVSEIRDLAALAKEFNYRLVISGAVEAWVLPEELAEANASVIISPRIRREARFGEEDRSGSWIELPRVLEESGIPFAVQALSDAPTLGGIAGRDLTGLPLDAAFAVRGGASEAKALAAITIVPATMLGLQNRIGSIEVGKDADLLVLDGPPLDYRTYVEKAIVNGNVVYDRQADRVYPVFER
jgi:imidazolonepropionase-like amidohydrolase